MKSLKFIYLLTTAALAALLFPACGDKDCPGFPEYLADYYPYKTGDTLLFSNNRNSDTIVFYVTVTGMTEEHSIPGGCNDCACLPLEFRFYANSGIMVMGQIILHPDESSICLEIGKNYLQASAGTDISNPELFGRKVTLKKRSGSISSATVEKRIGIVDFFDEEQNCLWTRVEND